MLENPYIPHTPTGKQALFLSLIDEKEILYGGAVGGGKSDALLMAALQFVDCPQYAALILRKTYKDLSLPGALIPRSKEWLANTDAKWNENEKRWTFPSGATLTFGYIQYDNDKFQYQSSEFQFIGYDEVTQFDRREYTWMFNRLRRLEGSNIPNRVRAASNPADNWVKGRFDVEKNGDGALFIPARLEDNPYIDTEEYEESLKELDPVTRQRYRKGDWTAQEKGDLFDRAWFRAVERSQVPDDLRVVRYWDLAATDPKEKSNADDPDYTVGVKMGARNGQYYILDVRRIRKEPGPVETYIRRVAENDGYDVPVWIEQEPGSSGKGTISHYSRNVLDGFAFRGNKVTGSKYERARPVSATAYNGNLFIVRASWNGQYLDEMEGFPEVEHDDCVDATSGAMEALRKTRPRENKITASSG